jgi:hypothetical protein
MEIELRANSREDYFSETGYDLIDFGRPIYNAETSAWVSDYLKAYGTLTEALEVVPGLL